MWCSLVFLQAVNIISHLTSYLRVTLTLLRAVYFPYTGEELWAQLWWLPVESMSRSIFLCRWHQQGHLPASCYGSCSLGDCSQEHHSWLHTQSAYANTQSSTNNWAIHRYRSYMYLHICTCTHKYMQWWQITISTFMQYHDTIYISMYWLTLICMLTFLFGKKRKIKNYIHLLRPTNWDGSHFDV